ASLAPVKSHSAPPVATHPPVQTQTVAVRGTATRARYDLVQPQLKRPPLLPPLPKLNYLPLSVIAALALTAIFLGPRLLHHRTPVQQTAIEPSSSPSIKPIPAVAHT